MNTAAPLQPGTDVAEDISTETTPLLRSENGATTNTAPANSAPPVDELHTPAQDSALCPHSPTFTSCAVIGFFILLYWRIASSYSLPDVSSPYSAGEPHHLAPDQIQSHNDNDSRMIYHTIGSVPFDVVSNKTYHLSPDAKYVNIVSSFSKHGGRTTIESASDTTPYITVEAIWKTRSAKFHPTVPEFRDDNEFASITFYPNESSGVDDPHLSLDLTIRLPPNRHYPWISFESHAQMPCSHYLDVKNLTEHGITFDHVRLYTCGDISVVDVTSDSLVARTSMGHILGHFNVPKSRIDLETLNGAVIRQ